MVTKIEPGRVRRYFGRDNTCTREIGTCIEEFAAGWINPAEFCTACACQLIVALDWIAGKELKWHELFVARAEGRVYQLPVDLQPDGSSPAAAALAELRGGEQS